MVADRDVKGGVIIKARCKADIWNVYRQFAAGHTGKKGKGRRYPMSRPVSHVKWDYRYGIKMKKSVWAKIAYRLVMRIDYSLFKGAVNAQPDQHNKHSAYLSIWSTMLRVQQQEESQKPGKNGQEYFNFSDAWQRELDYASGRFEYVDPVPTKTIKSVMLDNNNDNGN